VIGAHRAFFVGDVYPCPAIRVGMLLRLTLPFCYETANLLADRQQACEGLNAVFDLD
jgi:hypothetical protein